MAIIHISLNLIRNEEQNNDDEEDIKNTDNINKEENNQIKEEITKRRKN